MFANMSPGWVIGMCARNVRQNLAYMPRTIYESSDMNYRF